MLKAMTKKVRVIYGPFKGGTYEVHKEGVNVIEIKGKYGIGIVKKEWTEEVE